MNSPTRLNNSATLRSLDNLSASSASSSHNGSRARSFSNSSASSSASSVGACSESSCDSDGCPCNTMKFMRVDTPVAPWSWTGALALLKNVMMDDVRSLANSLYKIAMWAPILTLGLPMLYLANPEELMGALTQMGHPATPHELTETC